MYRIPRVLLVVLVAVVGAVVIGCSPSAVAPDGAPPQAGSNRGWDADTYVALASIPD